MPDPHANSCCNYSDLIEFIHSPKLLCLSSSHSLPVRAGAPIDGVGRDRGSAWCWPWGFFVSPELLGNAKSPPRQRPADPGAEPRSDSLGEALLHFYRKITSNWQGNHGTKVTNGHSMHRGGMSIQQGPERSRWRLWRACVPCANLTLCSRQV